MKFQIEAKHVFLAWKLNFNKFELFSLVISIFRSLTTVNRRQNVWVFVLPTMTPKQRPLLRLQKVSETLCYMQFSLVYENYIPTQWNLS